MKRAAASTWMMIALAFALGSLVYALRASAGAVASKCIASWERSSLLGREKDGDVNAACRRGVEDDVDERDEDTSAVREDFTRRWVRLLAIDPHALTTGRHSSAVESGRQVRRDSSPDTWLKFALATQHGHVEQARKLWERALSFCHAAENCPWAVIYPLVAYTVRNGLISNRSRLIEVLQLLAKCHDQAVTRFGSEAVHGQACTQEQHFVLSVHRGFIWKAARSVHVETDVDDSSDEEEDPWDVMLNGTSNSEEIQVASDDEGGEGDDSRDHSDSPLPQLMVEAADTYRLCIVEAMIEAMAHALVRARPRRVASLLHVDQRRRFGMGERELAAAVLRALNAIEAELTYADESAEIEAAAGDRDNGYDFFTMEFRLPTWRLHDYLRSETVLQLLQKAEMNVSLFNHAIMNCMIGGYPSFRGPSRALEQWFAMAAWTLGIDGGQAVKVRELARSAAKRRLRKYRAQAIKAEGVETVE